MEFAMEFALEFAWDGLHAVPRWGRIRFGRLYAGFCVCLSSF